jgi:hypothetical protein
MEILLELDSERVAYSVISGLVIGLGVSIILGLNRMRRNYFERRRQMRYVSEVVSHGINSVRKTGSYKGKIFFYNMMLRELEYFLQSEASSRIRFVEKQTLRTALPYAVDGSIQFLTQPPDNPNEFFHQATEQFEGVKWLTLRATEELSQPFFGLKYDL